MPITTSDVYSPREIALAAGVPESQVRAALGPTLAGGYVSHAEAVRLGRALASRTAPTPARGAMSVRQPATMFSVMAKAFSRRERVGRNSKISLIGC